MTQNAPTSRDPHPPRLLRHEDLPQVSNAEMNAVHEDEIDLLNEVLVLLPQAATYAEARHALDYRLQALHEHMRTHFSREEELMRQYGFPVYPVHKGEHDRVYAELEQVIADWQTHSDMAALRHYIHEVFPSWLFQHIASMDQVTARFLAEVMQSRK
ncbi:hemerythrin [Thiohalobacter thiocyanaticus]|uniref:Hemerythrin n=1 Tax=Thiohalobacter thiocyanaticus TaxID=585455 RepID=A0A1Z4VM68_9GAMM|nr:hemerythrin family protein [Thiohalobacter thiocyanaticus]BAZ92532.1 hemerythrin [Thiohalobacter thiocyanaticus]